MDSVTPPPGGRDRARLLGAHAPVTEDELDGLAARIRARRDARLAARAKTQAEYDAILAKHVQHPPGSHAHPNRIALGLNDDALDYSGNQEWLGVW